MAIVPSVNLVARRLRGLPQRDPSPTRGILIDKLRDACERTGLLFGQYGALTGCLPGNYFRRYGLTRTGFELFRAQGGFGSHFSGLTTSEAFARFVGQSRLKPRYCSLYIHVLEVLQIVYGLKWQVLDQRVILDHYPICPDGRVPSLFDLLAGWIKLVPREDEWRDGLSLQQACAGQTARTLVSA